MCLCMTTCIYMSISCIYIYMSTCFQKKKNAQFIFLKHICIPICAYTYPFVCVHISIHKCILCTNVFAKCADKSNKIQKYILTCESKKKQKRQKIHNTFQPFKSEKDKGNGKSITCLTHWDKWMGKRTSRLRDLSKKRREK